MTTATASDNPHIRRLEFAANEETRKQSFLAVHLQLLKALYANNEATNGYTTATAVEDNVFDMILLFLDERDRLILAKKETLRRRGIYEEAAKVAEPDEKNDDDANPSAVQSSTHSTLKRKSFSPRPSPVLSMQSPHLRASNWETNEPFKVVARLLQLRSTECSKQFQNDTDRFRPLLHAARQEIKSLEEQMEALQAAVNANASNVLEKLLSTSSFDHENDAASTTEPGSESPLTSASHLAESGYKIKLWKLLARDIEQLL
jgi:hypothetical protein